MSDKPILEMRGITKTFPGVKALQQVNFTSSMRASVWRLLVKMVLVNQHL